MKYILMLTGTKAEFDWYAKWTPADYAMGAYYRAAAGKTGSLPERNYLLTPPARLSSDRE